jgi:dsRNA-specific ribonuclease
LAQITPCIEELKMPEFTSSHYDFSKFFHNN